MKSLLPFFIPQKLAEFHTPFNDYIRINDEGWENKLLVNGSPQSGKYIRQLWQSAFRAFPVKNKRVQTILVLGVGGGTAIKELHAMFPQARITGVEIDPTMIIIGKKFFSLEDLSKLRVIESDALEFTKKAVKQHVRYDMIIVDVFSGRIIPSFVLDPVFIRNLRTLIRHQGCIIINYLRELEYEQLSNVLKKRLENTFSIVHEHSIYRNRFFFGSIV